MQANPDANGRLGTKAFMDQIAAMRQAVGDATDVVNCAPFAAAATIGSTSTPLDGTWAVTYTQSQLQAAGPGCASNDPSNCGHFTLTFDRGQWREAGPLGTNDDSAGTYVVASDNVTFFRHDQAYPGSDGEIWGQYIWSVYRGALIFKNMFVGGPCLNVKSWLKVGG
jgi:hypothetical protein